MARQSLSTITINVMLAFSALCASTTTLANECDYYRERGEYYQRLRSMGGNADEMNRWTAIGHELDDQLYQCERDTQINPTVQAVSGEKPAPAPIPKRGHTPLRSSISDDQQLQSLIKTCNYWITASNENATPDNINFRDTACHAVDNYKKELNSGDSVTHPQAVRKLKDCIKPNNLIDSDVNACVQGNLEPTWKK